MNKKLSFMLVCLFAFVLVFNNVFAVTIWDSKSSSGIYKTSEDDSDFKLPFIRVNSQRVEIDEDMSQTGIICTTSTVDVNAKLLGRVIICSNDTVRINNDVDFAIICSTGDVVINSTVKDAIIFSTGSVTISEEANVTGNLTLYTNELTVNGAVDGNILGAAEVSKFNNVIKGQLRFDSDNIEFGENAKVEGGIYINTYNKDLKIDESVGTATIDVVEQTTVTWKTYLYRIVNGVITNLVIYLIILLFVKKDRLNKMMEKMEANRVLKGGAYAFIGLLCAVCMGIVLLMLLAKLGVAALVFAIACYIIVGLLKNVIFGTFVVKLVEKRYTEAQIKPNNILVAIMTFLILEILDIIPIVNVIVSVAVFIFALGIIVALFGKKEEKPVTTETIKVE